MVNRLIEEHNNKNEPMLSMESVSAVFAHDIATPLSTARLNAELLVEHIDVLTKALASEEGSHIPSHIRAAIERSPQLILQSMKSVQDSLSEYKSYLNSMHEDIDAYQIQEKSEKNEDYLLNKLKILLVDDEDIHHDIGDVVLGKHHDLHHESGGWLAVERCQKEVFDLILMDMKMSDINGQEAVEKLREFIPQSTLIFGLTSMPIASQKESLLASGFNGFLDKPLKMSAFNKLITEK